MNAGLSQNQILQLNRNSRFGFMEPERLFSSRTKNHRMPDSMRWFRERYMLFFVPFSGRIRKNKTKHAEKATSHFMRRILHMPSKTDRILPEFSKIAAQFLHGIDFARIIQKS